MGIEAVSTTVGSELFLVCLLPSDGGAWGELVACCCCLEGSGEKGSGDCMLVVSTFFFGGSAGIEGVVMGAAIWTGCLLPASAFPSSSWGGISLGYSGIGKLFFFPKLVNFKVAENFSY